ncbi:hypothetical protein JTE90_002344 [Oedothorax gibbosus]|uniref:Uncharacterized protein n=1 Tax=Oedothorax gibbosus TaxID=931172 RepID=A0AAV6UJR9_9ARAC|nr:hypothetical protein JTE90_002344 [Oedothorax gibbosus]
MTLTFIPISHQSHDIVTMEPHSRRFSIIETDEDYEPSGSEDSKDSSACLVSSEEICLALRQSAPHSQTPIHQMSIPTFVGDNGDRNNNDIFPPNAVSNNPEAPLNNHDLDKPQGTRSIIIITADRDGSEIDHQVHDENGPPNNEPDLDVAGSNPLSSFENEVTCEEVQKNNPHEEEAVSCDTEPVIVISAIAATGVDDLVACDNNEPVDQMNSDSESAGKIISCDVQNDMSGVTNKVSLKEKKYKEKRSK